MPLPPPPLSSRGGIDGFLSGLYHLHLTSALTCVLGRLADRIIAERLWPKKRMCERTKKGMKNILLH